MIDVVRGHSELLLVVDDLRFSESSHERQCFESVSPSHKAPSRCTNDWKIRKLLHVKRPTF